MNREISTNACFFEDEQARRPKIAVIEFDGGARVKTFDSPVSTEAASPYEAGNYRLSVCAGGKGTDFECGDLSPLFHSANSRALKSGPDYKAASSRSTQK